MVRLSGRSLHRIHVLVPDPRAEQDPTSKGFGALGGTFSLEHTRM